MKQLTILIAALFMALMVNAQTELAGLYKIDRSKSQLSQEFSMAPNEVSIKVSENEFLVEKKVSFQGNAFTISDKYTLDGKECLNPGWAETIKKSTAAWDKQAKKLTVTTKIPMQDGDEMTIVEIFSKSGDQLEIDTKATSPYGDGHEKYVLVKK